MTSAALFIAMGAAALTPQRQWLERLALAVPGPAASRCLLVADAVCLIALGLRTRCPVIGVPAGLGAGFAILNAFGMGFTDFYLGLAAFHFLVAITTLAVVRRPRWLGPTALALVLVLGVAT